MLHALIIDDDPLGAEVLVRLLDAEGITATAITEPVRVQARLADLPPLAIVFLDLEMPKMNGYQVLSILKQHLPPEVPVVAYTVHVSEAEVAWEQGFHSFLSKPIDQGRFSELLARILQNDPVWEV